MNRTRKHIETIAAEAAGADRGSIEGKCQALKEVREVLRTAVDSCYACDDWLVEDLQDMFLLAHKSYQKAERYLEDFKDEDAINDADDAEYKAQQRDMTGRV